MLFRLIWLEARHIFRKLLTSYISNISRTSNDCFDVKRCKTCAHNITEILIAFNRETEFENKYP